MCNNLLRVKKIGYNLIRFYFEQGFRADLRALQNYYIHAG